MPHRPRPPEALAHLAAGLTVACLALAGCSRDGGSADESAAIDPTSSTTVVSAPNSTATIATTNTPITDAPTTTSSSSTTIAPSTTMMTTTSSTTTSTTSTTLPVVTLPPTTIAISTTTTARTLPPLGGAGGSIRAVRPPSDIPAPALPEGWVAGVVGETNAGTEITAWYRPVDDFRRRVMVIGGVHGNEPVSPPAVRGFVEAAIPLDIEVWLIPELNPDGVVAGTRWNASGVDLNRNFSWDWRPSDGGPSAFSEGESQTVAGMINAFEPDLVVWMHQPYGYVSSIGATGDEFEQAWSAATGLRVRPDVTQHGGGESWTAFVAERPSMLIEIDSWEATPEMVATQRAGFEAVVALL